MTETASQLSLFQDLVGSFNHGDRERFVGLLAPDATARTVDGSEVHGADGIADWMWAYRDAFPDLHVEIIESLVALDRGAAVLRSHGRQTRPLRLGTAALPPSNREVTWDACYLWRVADGRIDRLAIYADALSFQEQLGDMPV